jgi:hypothetical protein
MGTRKPNEDGYGMSLVPMMGMRMGMRIDQTWCGWVCDAITRWGIPIDISSGDEALLTANRKSVVSTPKQLVALHNWHSKDRLGTLNTHTIDTLIYLTSCLFNVLFVIIGERELFNICLSLLLFCFTIFNSTYIRGIIVKEPSYMLQKVRITME